MEKTENNFESLILAIWEARIKVIAITLFACLMSVVYALSLPNQYKSTVKLTIAASDSGSNISALASKYGSLAAMAGINLGGGAANNIEFAEELVKSWPFLDSFIKQYDLKPSVMAVKGWNAEDDSLIYDKDIFDKGKSAWKKSYNIWGQESGETSEPTDYRTFKHFKDNMLSVRYDDSLGILSISISHFSPKVADQVLSKLVFSLNQHFLETDVIQAEQSIKFLEKKIESISNTQMREVFYNMIESHTQTLMLAEVSDEYYVKTLIPSKVAEEKDRPNRALICIMAFLLAFTGTSSYFAVKQYFQCR